MPAQILVVDDSEFVRRYYSQVLGAAGLRAVGAADGTEALAAAQGTLFDAVLTDVNMTPMDGLEFTRRLRLLPDYGEVPVLLQSTQGSEAARAAGLAAGADMYLVKPCDPATVVQEIQRLLSVRTG